MGLLDGLIAMFIADRIITFAIFVVMFLVMIGLLVGFVLMGGNIFDDSNTTSESGGHHHYKVKIITDGVWKGSLSSDDVKMEDISGTGDKTIDLGNSDASDVNVDISKGGDSSEKLTVKLYSDGKVIDTDSTNDPSGSVLISA